MGFGLVCVWFLSCGVVWVPKLVVGLLCHLNNMLGNCFPKLCFWLGLVLCVFPKLVLVAGNLVPQVVCLGWLGA